MFSSNTIYDTYVLGRIFLQDFQTSPNPLSIHLKTCLPLLMLLLAANAIIQLCVMRRRTSFWLFEVSHNASSTSVPMIWPRYICIPEKLRFHYGWRFAMSEEFEKKSTIFIPLYSFWRVWPVLACTFWQISTWILMSPSIHTRKGSLARVATSSKPLFIYFFPLMVPEQIFIDSSNGFCNGEKYIFWGTFFSNSLLGNSRAKGVD